MKNNIKLALLLGSMLLNWNCTDLEENILDESLNPSTEGIDEAVAAIAPVYANANNNIWRHTNYFSMQEKNALGTIIRSKMKCSTYNLDE